ncbi:hypothetical protein [Bacillus tuaregi]|uniref:hypothetical protein n=1 Tax=Bacillus tuaregi TaxID=1816695 RepID=UPI0008F84C1F|nr:hypothetical protein [Bacillus tuaregi]
MFFKKKKQKEEEEQIWYCVGIITEEGTNLDNYDSMTEKIMDEAENVGILSGLVKGELDPRQLQILYRRFYQPDFSKPCIIINEIDHGKIKRETERLEKEHKWKKFFGLLSIADYQAAEDRALFDFQKTLYLTEDADEAIQFLEKLG